MLKACGLVLLLALVPAAHSARAADFESTIPARQALRMTLREVKVENVSLAKVMRFLQDTSGANIVVRWKTLEAINVTKDTPITLEVSNLSLRKVLQLVLDQAAVNANLVWTIDENVIEITTQEETDKRMLTRVYVVDDLVMPANRNQIQPPTLGLGSSQTYSTGTGGAGGGGGLGLGGGAGGGAGGGGLFPNLQQQNNQGGGEKSDTEKAGQELVSLIMSTIRPNIWKENGGNASIRFFQGKLIVTAPVSVQEAIGGPVPDNRRYGF